MWTSGTISCQCLKALKQKDVYHSGGWVPQPSEGRLSCRCWLSKRCSPPVRWFELVVARAESLHDSPAVGKWHGGILLLDPSIGSG